MVTGTVSLANWYPTYINLLLQQVNVPIYYSIYTTLSATTQPLLLDPVAYGDAGTTAI